VPEIVDVDLRAPAADLPAGARVVGWLDGAPVGVVRRADSLDAAFEALEDELAIALAGRRLLGEDPPVSHSVTVVVCTRDRPELLDGCLAAVAEQERAPDEVLVVDNASTDDATRRVAKRWNARCVVEPVPGLDRARNRGLAEASTELVAFVDDDARPVPGWLAALVAPFASPDVHATTGLVLPVELRTPAQLLFEDVYGGMGKGTRLRVHGERQRRRRVRPERVGVGCNMAFRREALIGLGGFDPALDVGTRTGGGGDLDAFQRCLECTVGIVYVPGAVVRHLHRAEMDGLRRQLFDNGRGYGAMLAAAFARGDHARRRAVVRRGASWLGRWQLARLLGSIAGSERLPTRLVAAEVAGAPLGPALYLAERRAARGEANA
jgi:glycosyltransferase involved in cell wall biosynthesis